MSTNNALSVDVARQLLDFKFSEHDRERMHELAAKKNEGTLSKQECEELDKYVRAGDLLAILQSKARKLLKQIPSVPDRHR